MINNLLGLFSKKIIGVYFPLSVKYHSIFFLTYGFCREVGCILTFYTWTMFVSSDPFGTFDFSFISCNLEMMRPQVEISACVLVSVHRTCVSLVCDFTPGQSSGISFHISPALSSLPNWVFTLHVL